MERRTIGARDHVLADVTGPSEFAAEISHGRGFELIEETPVGERDVDAQRRSVLKFIVGGANFARKIGDGMAVGPSGRGYDGCASPGAIELSILRIGDGNTRALVLDADHGGVEPDASGRVRPVERVEMDGVIQHVGETEVAGHGIGNQGAHQVAGEGGVSAGERDRCTRVHRTHQVMTGTRADRVGTRAANQPDYRFDEFRYFGTQAEVAFDVLLICNGVEMAAEFFRGARGGSPLHEIAFYLLSKWSSLQAIREDVV